MIVNSTKYLYVNYCKSIELCLNEKDEQNMYLVLAGSILTGKDNKVIRSGAILIENNCIVYIGEKRNIPKINDKEIQIIDLTNFIVMPGLIDCHVHLAFDGSNSPVEHMKQSSDKELFELMQKNAITLLDSGVTTVRDLGARSYLDMEIKRMINNNEISGPNLLTSNRPITSIDGHCWFMGGECKDIHDIKNIIEDHVSHEADWIKIMASGGGLTEGTAMWEDQFSLQELTFTVEEAHKKNKRIAAHAHGTTSIKNVVKSNVDTIEHCTWVTKEGYLYNEEATQQIIEKNIYVCPTINTKWKKNEKRKRERIPQLKEMYQKGVKFITGTDAGISNVPHSDYVDGMEAMQEMGMKNEEIIFASTLLAAKGLGIGEITGSLEVGKRADLIAVQDNPYNNLSTLHRIEWIMVSGQIYKS